MLLILLLPVAARTEEPPHDSSAGKSRKGLLTSIGFGVGVVSLHQIFHLDGPDWKSPTYTKLALRTSVRLGYAPSDYFVPYICSNYSWFRFDFAATEDDEIARTGLLGIGMAFYTSSTYPSGYLFVEVGQASFGAPFAKEVGIRRGAGAAVGIGYVFSRRYSIELSTNYGTTNSTKLATNAWSYSISVVLN